MSFVVEIPAVFTKPTQVPIRLGNSTMTGSEHIEGNLSVNGSLTLNARNSNYDDDSGVVFYDSLDVSNTLNVGGQLTKPNQINFRASGTLNTINTDSILTYDIVHDNVGNGYDSSTYKFIAPVEGTYLFYVSVGINGNEKGFADIIRNRASVETSQQRIQKNNTFSGTDMDTYSCTITFPCMVGDEVYVKRVNSEGGIVLSPESSLFGGYLLG